ncbi:MAG TPA: type I glyceraldehyde-3-phosphate dehydrogenase [Geobacteraceae bacterium]
MSIRVAINGFGRIGRSFLRRAWRAPGIEIAAINDLAEPAVAAHLLSYDSVAGRFAGRIRHEPGALIVAGRRIPYFSQRHPEELPWRATGIDIVLEATGVLTRRVQALRHLDAGAARVIVTAPSDQPDITVVLGVNQHELDPGRHWLISNASCTTNCLAPLIKTLDDAFGIERGFFTTVHAYTNGQPLLDLPHADLRRARAAAMSMIPTTTGATRALCQVLPHLEGRVDGLSIRVPTPNVSLVDLTLTVGSRTTAAEVNRLLKSASRRNLRGIIDHLDGDHVSSDMDGNEHSAVVNGSLTTVSGGDLVRVVAWYDNEAAFSRRLVELVRLVGTV